MTAEQQLKQFIDKFEPSHRSLIRGVRKAMRARLPGACEFVYDNYNFFVIGYGPTERPSEAVLSIAAGANGVSICFLQGAKLRDPNKLLQGAGKQTRFMRVESAAVLKRPEVETLVAAALRQSAKPLPAGPGKLIIKSISAKQRPRRKI